MNSEHESEEETPSVPRPVVVENGPCDTVSCPMQGSNTPLYQFHDLLMCHFCYGVSKARGVAIDRMNSFTPLDQLRDKIYSTPAKHPDAKTVLDWMKDTIDSAENEMQSLEDNRDAWMEEALYLRDERDEMKKEVDLLRGKVKFLLKQFNCPCCRKRADKCSDTCLGNPFSN